MPLTGNGTGRKSFGPTLENLFWKLGPDLPAPDETLGTTRVTKFSGDRLIVEVDASDEAVLINRDNYAPGWSVTVDGEASELLVVDRVNKAVALSPGVHRVEFVYRPWLYLVAFGLRAAALLAAVVICAVLLFQSRRRPANLAPHDI